MPEKQVTGPDEARIAPRTNMFIAAVLHGSSGACPVRIRNMSRSGALIEGPVLPPQGEHVALVRSDLRVTGKVAWRTNGRCGVRLDSAVAVAQWMTNPTNRKQSQVDHIVAEIKSGVSGDMARSVPSFRHDPSADVREDIEHLRLMIEATGEDLASIPETLVRHASSLQHLDLAVQMLDALTQAVDPDPELRRAGAIRLHSLRQGQEKALRSAA